MYLIFAGFDGFKYFIFKNMTNRKIIQDLQLKIKNYK